MITHRSYMLFMIYIYTYIYSLIGKETKFKHDMFRRGIQMINARFASSNTININWKNSISINEQENIVNICRVFYRTKSAMAYSAIIYTYN